MSREEWREVPGWEGIYSVSTLGRVRRDAGGKGTQPGLILKGTITTKGYRRVILYKNGDRTLRNVHQVVAMAFLGEPPSGQGRAEVNHLDGDKTNDRIENLEWTTRRGNARHAQAIGLMSDQRGSANGYSVLTESQVREMRRLHSSGEYRHIDLARRYGVSRTTVSNVLSRKAWRHV